MALRPGAVGGASKAAAAGEATAETLVPRRPRRRKAEVQPAEEPAAPRAMERVTERAVERPMERSPAGQLRLCRPRRVQLKSEAIAERSERATATRRRKAERAAAAQVEAWQGLLDDADGRLHLAETLLKVRGKNGRLVPLVANAVQRQYEAESGAENIVLKARQMGMSTWIAGQFLLRTVLVPGTVTLQVAHTREAAMGLFRMVQRMHAHLPKELREHSAKLGRKSKTEMTFPAIDSEIRIASAGEENAGRGMTVTHLHLSEVARWQGDAAETLAGLRAAVAPGGMVVLESTPNGAYGCFYTEWRTAERRGARRHFFPWWMEPGYVGAACTDPTAEEALLGLSPEQVGFRRELRERFGGMAAQEFAEDAVSCFRESGSCAFESSAVVARLLEVTGQDGPVAVETRWNGALRVWLPAVAGRSYLLAADPAGGSEGGDFAAVQVVDAATGVQCAEVQARWAPRMLATRVMELAREFGNALVVVERNNHGAAVLGFLEEAHGLRLYHGVDGKPGFLTSAQSRPEMLLGLGVLLSTRPQLFCSGRLLEECRTFAVKDGGRMEAAAGSHDDLVLAMAMAQAVRRG